MTDWAGQIVWQASAEAVLPSQGAASWRHIMGRLRLPMSEVPVGELFYGSVAVYDSPVGLEFTVLDAAPHKISGTYLNQKDASWLFVIIKGLAVLLADDETEFLSEGILHMGRARLTRRLAFPRTSGQCMFGSRSYS